MSNSNSMPTFEQMSEMILAGRNCVNAAFEIAKTDGDKKGARSFGAIVRRYDKLIAEHHILPKPRKGPEPSLEQWRALLSMPKKSNS